MSGSGLNAGVNELRKDHKQILEALAKDDKVSFSLLSSSLMVS